MQYEFTGGMPTVFPTLSGRELDVYRDSEGADVTVRDATFMPGDVVTLDDPIVHANLVPRDNDTGRATAMQALADNPGDVLDPDLAVYVPELFDVVDDEPVDAEPANAGTKQDVLDRVERGEVSAADALAAEQSSDNPRVTLVDALDTIIIEAAERGSEGSN